MKKFNTTAVCIPSKHYMVDISEKVAAIRQMIDAGEYFSINRARQYGKTTTLTALKENLRDSYSVLSLDFQGIGNAGFSTEERFVQEFCRLVWNRRKTVSAIPEDVLDRLRDWKESREPSTRLGELFDALTEWCEESEKGVVLIIDEVDSATNNQVFLDFLSQLRDKYIARDTEGITTFQSVILAGVTDVRHLKLKIRDEKEHKVNSPWNIAADFDIDLSLSAEGICGMLRDYEADHGTGMDTEAVAGDIYEYTNGYPYLVSRICEVIDQRLLHSNFGTPGEAWTSFGVDEAVKIILSESNNALFNSLTGKLINYPVLKKKLRAVLMRGEVLAWLPYDEEQQQLYMYGFIRNNHNTVAVSNRIFEMLLYTHFIGESSHNDDLKQRASEYKSVFVDEDGWLNIPEIMDRFIKEHNRIHAGCSEKLLEEEGRERFITYVSAIINGTGTYSVEEQTRNHRRMDLVIHYLGRRYIVELKIWRGERYNADGERQIMDYLSYWGLDTGYLLSFSFNKNKKPGVERVSIGDKVLFEGVV